MDPSGTLQLRTIGHACLLILENGEPILATDPWLIGSVYWRSWWLEKYPSEDDIDVVRRSRYLYITHSHLDHFHWPSLRRLGPATRPAAIPRRHGRPGTRPPHRQAARCARRCRRARSA